MEEEANKPYGFIYITTNLINGKKYVGQKTYNNRWKCYLGSGKYFKLAVKKHGRENFVKEIVAIAYCKDELNKLEAEYIKKFNAVQSADYYNVATDSFPSYIGLKHTEDYKIKMKILNEGKLMSEKSKERMKENHYDVSGENNPNYGKHWSEEWRTNHSKAISGENNVLFGTHRSEETKRKISESNKGKIFSEKHLQNLSKAHKGKELGSSNPKAKKVVCLTENKIFDTLKDAAEYYNCTSSNISMCCSDRSRKHAGKLSDGTKLQWMYYSDYLLLV